MRTLSRWFMALAVVACISGAAIAQQPGRPQGGGGGGFGGFGGFGGGGGGFSVKSFVLTSAALQEELKISDALKAKFVKYQEMQAAEREKASALGNEDEDQIARLKMQIKGIEDRMAIMKELTPEQTKRLTQIDRQMMGMRVYTNEKVVAELKLSDGQKEQVKAIVADYNKESGEIMGGGRGGQPGGAAGGRGQPGAGGAGGRGAAGGIGAFGRQISPENQKKLDALREEATEKIEKQLNDEQRKQWKEIIGTKFDTSKLFQRRQDN